MTVADNSPPGNGHFWVVLEKETARQGIHLNRSTTPFTAGNNLKFKNLVVLYKPDQIQKVGLRYQRLPKQTELSESAYFSKITFITSKDSTLEYCPIKGSYAEVAEDWVDFRKC